MASPLESQQAPEMGEEVILRFDDRGGRSVVCALNEGDLGATHCPTVTEACVIQLGLPLKSSNRWAQRRSTREGVEMTRVSPLGDQSRSIISSLLAFRERVSDGESRRERKGGAHLIGWANCNPEANSDDLESQIDSSYCPSSSVTGAGRQTSARTLTRATPNATHQAPTSTPHYTPP